MVTHERSLRTRTHIDLVTCVVVFDDEPTESFATTHADVHTHTLNEIFAQTYASLEVMIVDGTSGEIEHQGDTQRKH